MTDVGFDRCPLSDQSALSQRHARTVAHDDVVQQTYIHQGEGLLDSLRDEFVGLARLSHAARVVVRDYHRG